MLRFSWLIFGLIFIFGGAKSGAAPFRRALLVVSELDHRGVPELGFLYRKIEALAWALPSQIQSIQSLYFKQKLIANEQATSAGVQSAIREMLLDPEVEVLDVILGVHGRNEILSFYDGAVGVEEWVSQLKQQLAEDTENPHAGPDVFDLSRKDGNSNFLGKKLGLLYNLSCYGATHLSAFLKLGFQSAIGSRKVNANAELEYPWVLKALAAGYSVKEALQLPNSPQWLRVLDAPLRGFGKIQDNFLKDVDSFKEIGGQAQYRLRLTW